FDFSLCLFIHTSSSFLYTYSLHDALPIYPIFKMIIIVVSNSLLLLHVFSQETVVMTTSLLNVPRLRHDRILVRPLPIRIKYHLVDRKRTRLNSSHVSISYAVFCLKQKTMQ